MAMWIAQQAAMEAISALEKARVPYEHEIDVFSVIERAGLPLIFRPLRHFSGAYIPAGESASSRAGILINSNHPRSLQRYTAAHEYAHHIQDQTLSIDQETEIVERTQQTALPERERFAEVFASWFLMPPQLITTLKKRLGTNISYSNPEDIYQLSLALGTSYRATITQLVSLKEISWAQANQLRKWQPKEIKEKLSWDDLLIAPRNDIWVINKNYNDYCIHPRVGDELRLSLSEVPSTGYIWLIENLEPIMTLADQRFVEVETGIFGGGGIREFRFSIAQAGTLNLILTMQRPWIGGESETGSFHIRLIVEDERLGINPEMLLVKT